MIVYVNSGGQHIKSGSWRPPRIFNWFTKARKKDSGWPPMAFCHAVHSGIYISLGQSRACLQRIQTAEAIWLLYGPYLLLCACPMPKQNSIIKSTKIQSKLPNQLKRPISSEFHSDMVLAFETLISLDWNLNPTYSDIMKYLSTSSTLSVYARNISRNRKLRSRWLLAWIQVGIQVGIYSVCLPHHL